MKAKACWLATETRKGWRLKLCVGPMDYPVRGLLLDSDAEVRKVMEKLGTVFVHLKETRQ